MVAANSLRNASGVLTQPCRRVLLPNQPWPLLFKFAVDSKFESPTLSPPSTAKSSTIECRARRGSHSNVPILTFIKRVQRQIRPVPLSTANAVNTSYALSLHLFRPQLQVALQRQIRTFTFCDQWSRVFEFQSRLALSRPHCQMEMPLYLSRPQVPPLAARQSRRHDGHPISFAARLRRWQYQIRRSTSHGRSCRDSQFETRPLSFPATSAVDSDSKSVP
jgi:hypothetical protein